MSNVINLTKKENLVIQFDKTVETEEIQVPTFDYDGKNLEVSIVSGYIRCSFMIKNFNKFLADSVILKTPVGDYDLKSLTYDVSTYKNYTGTFLNEHVIGFNNYNQKINTGAGDDVIEAGIGKDTITGGTGNNTIIYNKGDGNDIINLTKNENLVIDMKGLNKEDLSFSFSGGNLLVKYLDDGGNTETITIKNFGKKDVVGANGSVYMTFNGGSITEGEYGIDYIDLKSDTSIYVYDNFTNKKTSYAGNWHNEVIDASSLDDYEMKKNKGVTISSGDGNDEISGSKYNDTLKGGNGDDVIRGQGGNDKIYGGLGYNKLIFKSGDGADSVYSTKNGNDTFVFEDVNFENLNFKKEKNNLVISGYGDSTDSVTVIDYYKGNSSVKNILINDVNKPIEQVISEKSEDSNPEVDPTPEPSPDVVDDGFWHMTGKHIDGTNGNDTLKGTNKNDIIHGKLGSDKIYGYGGDDRIEAYTDAYVDGGDGDDYIYVERGFSTIKGGKGNDKIIGDGSDNKIYGGEGDDNIRVSGDFHTIYCGNNDSKVFSGNDTVSLNDSRYSEVYLEDGNNTITFYGEHNKIYSGNGNNTVKFSYSTSYNNIVTLGNGNNTFDFKGNNSHFNNVYKSGSGADVVNLSYSKSSNSEIYTGGGNDIFNIDYENVKGWFLNGESGDDVYNITFTSSGAYSCQNTIFDNSGNDSVIFKSTYYSDATKKQDLNLYINVHSNKNYDSDLIIYNNYNDKLTIQDYMGDGKIEKIQSSDNYFIDDSKMDNIIQQVASWLSKSSYETVQDVIDGGNATDINTVISKFTTAWTK